MSDLRLGRYDVAVVGAGPVGSLTAIAHASRGAKVLLLEANPKAAQRLAGEWLHPPALEILKRFGIDLPGAADPYPTGRGFVVFPEDDTEPMRLPYAGLSRGFSCHHTSLVSTLRQAAAEHPDVRYLPCSRVQEINGHQLYVSSKDRSGRATAIANRIVGADGRSSIVRRTLGLPVDHVICSRMVGMLLDDVELPFEGYGHVFIGGPGPLLAYRIGPHRVRLIADVPIAHWGRQERVAALWEGYWPVLPDGLRESFHCALRNGRFHGAANQLRQRTVYGRDGLALVGDAVGHFHPLTAVGLTLGFGDAHCLAQADTIDQYAARRARASHVPESLAVALYEILADHRDEALTLRQSIYFRWRASAGLRERTMSYLSCRDTRILRFATTFIGTVAHAYASVLGRALCTGQWAAANAVRTALNTRLRSLSATLLHLRTAHRRGFAGYRDENLAQTKLSGALLLSMPRLRLSPPAPDTSHTPRDRTPNTGRTCEQAAAALVRQQGKNGGWEGEMVWCPMLAAQYVLMCHVTDTPIAPGRRERLLVHFGCTRLTGGLWSLHAHATPSLFVTTLVYVAARLLGRTKADALLEPAAKFIGDQGGVASIPSWGKFWLAMLGLYEWHGVNPVLPEAWTLPRWVPLHPSRLYCHTRLIYMAMAVTYGSRFKAGLTPTIAALRDELYPKGYDSVDFSTARNTLRADDLYAPPHRALRALYRVALLIDRCHLGPLRGRIIGSLRDRIRWELRTTDHRSISPVSGLLNIIALWIADPADADCTRAIEKLEDWMWEDASAGTRMTGARSVAWDTAFALQALTAAAPHCDARRAVRHGADFLSSQQIRNSFAHFSNNDRIDPKGGWCFADRGHGWPVSDCTAEALSALLEIPTGHLEAGAAADAVAFILRCQNPDGGFGSYEARRSRFDLEVFNPAEMFGNSMTERSFIECTASCAMALNAYRREGSPLLTERIDEALSRAARWFRRRQQADGTWPGAWGVHFIYGTLFAVRGLLNTGAALTDPAIRKACRWLLARQRPDGGWGEHHTGCLTGTYTEHTTSQVIQTAWALIALLEAHDPDWPAIERGASFLVDMQGVNGEWPKQDMAGVFFHTALLDYTLYRYYFPLLALGLYESRRKRRLELGELRPQPSVSAGVSAGASRG